MVDLRRNRYDLPTEEFERLTEQCIERCTDPRSGLAVLELAGGEPVSDVARNIERELFDQAFGAIVPHTPDLMTHEYGAYEDRSTFFMSVDVESRLPVAVLRIIAGLPNKSTFDLQRAELLSSEQLDRYGFEHSTTWDVATVAVSRTTSPRKSRSAALTLYRALYTAALRDGVNHWTSIIDKKVLGSYTHLGIPFRQFHGVEPLSYLGSNAVACHAQVTDIRSSMIAVAKAAEPGVREQILALLNGSDQLPELADLRHIDMPKASANPDGAIA